MSRRVPLRHRFRAPAPADALFARLPRGGRFRFSPPGGPDVFGAAPFDVVNGTAARGDDSPLLLSALRATLPRVPSPRIAPAHFPGGAVAILPYEAGAALEGGPPASGADASPWYGLYDTFAVHHGEEVEVVSWGWDGEAFDGRAALRRARDLEERLRTGGARADEADGATGAGAAAGELLSVSLDEDAHADAVARIREHIRDGDIYQANLTARFSVRTALAPDALFALLLRDNPAPYAAYVETDDGAVVSCSPELLLRARGRELLTRPIKGTASRHPDAAEDRRRAEALLASAKDRAELLMITDLLRNDLGKVCAPGSVRVPALRTLESFPHLHHLVSTIRGTLDPARDVFDAVEAAFPCGSITGAPKRRAMEILRTLEPAPRGVYTGAVGWIGFDRSASLHVAIRTGRHADGVFSFGAGGGIVIDSTAEAEWRELHLKARAFARALGVEAALAPQENR